MKKCVLFALLFLFVLPLTACANQWISDKATADHHSAWTFVDYFSGEELPWGETIEKDVPAFLPNTQFQWTDSQFIAIEDHIKTVLIQGMPIWNVFVADLNRDGKPEFCATISMGSGIVDNRVIVVDYANHRSYDISDRMKYDYRLSKQGEKLIITRTLYPYIEQKNNDSLIGSLSIEHQQLKIAYTNGETQILEATASSE